MIQSGKFKKRLKALEERTVKENQIKVFKHKIQQIEKIEEEIPEDIIQVNGIEIYII